MRSRVGAGPAGAHRRGVVGRLGAVLTIALLLMGGLTPRTSAYEAATGSWSAPANNSSSLTLPSGLTATVTTGGYALVRESSTLGSKGFASDFFTPGTMIAGDAAVDIHSRLVGCEVVGTCSGLGTVTITFSRPVRNPTLHFVGLGGARFSRLNGVLMHQSDLHSTLTLQTPGVGIEAVSGNENFAVTDGVVTAVNDSASLSCVTPNGSANPAAAPASCGSARINGTVSTLSFELGAIVVQNPTAPNPARHMIDAGDVFGIAVTVPQDFGAGPASYDATQAPAHVLSDLTLGATVTEDNAEVRNSTTGVSSETTDAFDDLPDAVAQPGATYSLSVPVAGVGQQAQVCGYLDLDRDGRFDTAGERACAAAAAGATSVDLNWTIPAGVGVGESWARFRIGYTGSQVESPTGLADSGEVEDHPLRILARPQIILTKTTTGNPGGPFGYTLTNTTRPTGTVTTDTAASAVQVDGDPDSAGAQGFTVDNVGTEVTITEAETTGWQITGAICTTAEGVVVGGLSGATYTIPASEIVGGAVITCAFTNAEPVPGLTFAKTAGDIADLDGNGPDAGDSVAYSFTVTNTGATMLSDLVVTDPMVGAVSCPATTLAVGDLVTCSASHTLGQADVDAGQVVNTATVTARPPTGEAVVASDEVVSAVERRAALELVKMADTAGKVRAGDEVRFTFTVTNRGNVTLSEVRVSDPMTGPVACPVTTLAPGASVACTTAAYQVTTADVAAGRIVNTAVATARAAGFDQELTDRASVTVNVLTGRPLPNTGSQAGPAGLGATAAIGVVGIVGAVTGIGRRRLA